MSHNVLRFEGLDELRDALRALPTELTGEASHEIIGAANGAAADIKRAYPVGTGNLRDGVDVIHERGPFHAGATVRNTSKHAFIFENGTQTRRTSQGWNRGAMPSGRVFIPRMIRARRRMYEQLKALLVRKGLSVTGDAG
jgi:hypothetical protein